MPLRFDNRVAVITGAGGGLGRAYALLLGSLGAKVVVNDLGGSLSGGNTASSRAADVVVDEIKRSGGIAIANYDSVEHGEKIIQTATQAFGRVDILINNAGILRDKSMAKMTDDDWDLIMMVHLKGSFSCTKAAWPYMLKQQYGRIVNTASAAGLYGNFGQANYSAAKLALVGFTKSIAAEGARKNVFSNVIAPLAGTRMTEKILPKDVVDALRPEYIAPVVAWLCHEQCKDNGEVMECGAGWVAKLRWQRTKGKLFPKSFTPDDLQRDWQTVGDFSKDVTYPSSLQESLMMVTQSLESSSSTDGQLSKESCSSSLSKADKLFSLMGAFLKYNGGVEGERIVKKLGAKYFWDILEKKNGPIKASWTIDLKTGSGSTERGKVGEADATFIMAEEDFINVCLGKLNPQIGFIQGKMKIKGNMKAATKFTPEVFPKISADLLELSVEDAVKTYLGTTSQSAGPVNEAKAASRTISGTGLKSEPVINMMREFLQSPDAKNIYKKVGYAYQFDISPAKGKTPISFSIQLKTSPPSLKQETMDGADATFTMLDGDFLDLVKGKLNPQIAFVKGKMKIKGNMKAAMKFTPDLFPKPSNL